MTAKDAKSLTSKEKNLRTKCINSKMIIGKTSSRTSIIISRRAKALVDNIKALSKASHLTMVANSILNFPKNLLISLLQVSHSIHHKIIQLKPRHRMAEAFHPKMVVGNPLHLMVAVAER
jgi:hydrogenase maturation factor